MMRLAVPAGLLALRPLATTRLVATLSAAVSALTAAPAVSAMRIAALAVPAFARWRSVGCW
jgi:hypothetical protein